jgi:hypothetical protein
MTTVKILLANTMVRQRGGSAQISYEEARLLYRLVTRPWRPSPHSAGR